MAYAQEPASEDIAAVEFQGAESLSRERLDNLIQSRVGQPYDAKRVQEDIKSLSAVAEKVEARRSPHDGGVKLTFVLEAFPKIRDISMVGNSKLSTKRLLATLPVKAGGTLEVDSIAKCREKILKDYSAAGHMHTEVRLESIPHEDGTVSLQVFVNEGERLKIKEVKLEGAKNISPTRLRWQMDNKGSWLFFDNYFDETTFEEDLQAIARLYLSYGYFAADVRPGEFVYDEQRKEVSPVIQINEGPRHKIRSLKIEGATYFGQAEVQEPFSKLIDKPYDAEQVSKAVEKLQSLYGDEGFLLTLVSEDFQIDKAAAAVDVVIQIKERQRVRVGNVVIDRNPVAPDEKAGFFTRYYNKVAPPIKDETIRREVLLKPGDVYRKDLERRTLERLERLGIFEEVKAHSEPTDDEGVRDMVIEVQEGVTGNLLFGVGYGDESGAFVFGSYTERNLFGEARDLRVHALLGQRSLEGNIGYYDRYWRKDGSSLALDLFKRDYQRRGYDESTAGATAEIGKPLNEYLKAYFRARVGYVWLKETRDLAEDLSSYPVAAGQFRLEQDTRDSKVWPTRGVLRAAGVEAGYAGGPLAKLTGRYALYKTLKDDWIYAMNAEGGVMPFDASQVGITERFFLGGTDDLRGFAFRGAGPTDSKQTDVPIGGSTKLLIQNELRYTLLENLGVGRGQIPLRGVTFADVGLLGRGPLEIGTPRASVGTGLRIDMRHVNIGVDFALPVLKSDTDRTQFFHFKVSSEF